MAEKSPNSFESNIIMWSYRRNKLGQQKTPSYTSYFVAFGGIAMLPSKVFFGLITVMRRK